MQRGLLLLSISTLLGGCAASQTAGGALHDTTCLNVREVRDFDTVDDEHVRVTARLRRQYLLTLEPTCRGLRFARGIGFAEVTSRVCGDGTSWVVFDHAATGTKRCRIIAVERLDERDNGAE